MKYEITYYDEYSLDHYETWIVREDELAKRIKLLQEDGHKIIKVIITK